MTGYDFVDELPSSSSSSTPSQMCPDRPARSCIEFDTAGNGSNLLRGAYEKNEWLEQYGMIFVASSNQGFTPDVGPRLLGTANPGTEEEGFWAQQILELKKKEILTWEARTKVQPTRSQCWE